MKSCVVKMLSGCATLLLLIALAISGVAYYWGDLISGFLGLTPQMRAAELFPSETELYVGISLSLNEHNQVGYQKLKEIYFNQSNIQHNMNQTIQYLAELDIDLKKDLLTWIGTEIAFAVPTVNEQGESDYLFAIATWNSWGATAFIKNQLRRLSVKSGTLYQEKEYNGVKYWHLAVPNELGDEAAAMILNQFVLISNSEETLKEVISLEQSGGTTLAQSQRFQRAFETLPSDALIFGFFDSYSALSKFLSQWGTIPDIQEIGLLEAIEIIGMTLTLQSDGIQVDTAVQYDLDKLPPISQAMLNQTANSNRLLNRIPANTLFFSNSSNLNNFWLLARQEWAKEAIFEPLLAQLEAETGINIQQDLFNWMTGEFAFVLNDLNFQSSNSFFPFSGYLLVESNDLITAQNGMNKVTFLAKQFNAPIELQTISNIDTQIIVTPFINQPLAAFGFQENLFMLAIPETEMITLVEAPDNPIINEPQFINLQTKMPKNNLGYIYINSELIRQREEARLSDYDRQEYEKDLRPLIEPLRAIGVTAQAGLQANSIQNIRIYLLFSASEQ